MLLFSRPKVSFPFPELRDGAPFWVRLWTALPLRLRLYAYGSWPKLLNLFAPSKQRLSQRVYKLPFGLYLKDGLTSASAEAHAMWLVKRHTNVPAPMLVDYITCAIESHGFSYNAAYTLMTEVPGRPLSEVAHSLSDDELETIGLQLRGYVEELRAIPNPYPKQVCSASGGSIDCPRFTDAWEIPAYVDVPAFYAWLRMMVDKYWEICMKARLEPIFAKFDGPTVFTHGDIADRNIMIQDGKISGLIDWETAAWMPVYWEYYASLADNYCHTAPFNKMIKIALKEHYEDEMDAIGLISASLNPGFDPSKYSRTIVAPGSS